MTNFIQTPESRIAFFLFFLRSKIRYRHPWRNRPRKKPFKWRNWGSRSWSINNQGYVGGKSNLSCFTCISETFRLWCPLSLLGFHVVSYVVCLVCCVLRVLFDVLCLTCSVLPLLTVTYCVTHVIFAHCQFAWSWLKNPIGYIKYDFKRQCSAALK